MGIMETYVFIIQVFMPKTKTDFGKHLFKEITLRPYD